MVKEQQDNVARFFFWIASSPPITVLQCLPNRVPGQPGPRHLYLPYRQELESEIYQPAECRLSENNNNNNNNNNSSKSEVSVLAVRSLSTFAGEGILANLQLPKWPWAEWASQGELRRRNLSLLFRRPPTVSPLSSFLLLSYLASPIQKSGGGFFFEDFISSIELGSFENDVTFLVYLTLTLSVTWPCKAEALFFLVTSVIDYLCLLLYLFVCFV